MPSFFKLILPIVFAFVTGCTSVGSAIRTGANTYQIIAEKTGGGVFASMPALKEQAMSEAVSYCSRMGKQIRLLSFEEAPAIPFFRASPNVTVHFACD